MTTKCLLVFVILVLVVLISPCNAVRDEVCGDVNARFEPCEKFIVGITSSPTHKCCKNLMILNDNVKKEDNGVRKYCSCIVNFSNSHDHPLYLQSRIKQLYIFCNIHLSFPISEHMDCSKL